MPCKANNRYSPRCPIHGHLVSSRKVCDDSSDSLDGTKSGDPSCPSWYIKPREDQLEFPAQNLKIDSRSSIKTAEERGTRTGITARLQLAARHKASAAKALTKLNVYTPLSEVLVRCPLHSSSVSRKGEAKPLSRLPRPLARSPSSAKFQDLNFVNTKVIRHKITL